MTKLADNVLITKTLLRRFALEAVADNGDGRFYALIRRQDGNLLAHHPTGPQLDPMQMLWASRALKLLNREIDHDGAWVIVFTHPRAMTGELAIVDQKHWLYDRYALIWLDQDGDPQFTVEWAKGESELLDFVAVVMSGLESTAQKADAAWGLWHEMMRQVPEIKANDPRTFKRAQGEMAPSARRANNG